MKKICALSFIFGALLNVLLFPFLSSNLLNLFFVLGEKSNDDSMSGATKEQKDEGKEQEDEKEENGMSNEEYERAEKTYKKLDMYDTVHTYAPQRLAFGSCSKQYVQNNVWEEISKKKPDGWIWMGDAIYPECSSFSCVVEGYEEMQKNSAYKNFAKNLKFLDGCYDDHDYGQNDGGKYNIHKEESKYEFLNFLKIEKNCKNNDMCRYERKGVYSAHIFGLDENVYNSYLSFKKRKINKKEEEEYKNNNNKNNTGSNNKEKKNEKKINRKIKLIILDARYNRDNHYIRSVASTFSSLAIFSSILRFLCTFFGYGADYEGDMLGKEQWSWLEEILEEEKQNENDDETALHIFVSGVQICTSFPFVESWGHFPKSRQKFFQILKNKKIKNFIFLSGDVHFAQIIQNYEDPLKQQNTHNKIESKGMEITSSGLTHSVFSEYPFSSLFFYKNYFFRLFQKNKNKLKSSLFLKENFGVLNFDYKRDSVEVRGEIFDLNGELQLDATQKYVYNKKNDEKKQKEGKTEEEINYTFLDNIEEVMIDFECKIKIIFLALSPFWFLQICFLIFFNKKYSEKQLKTKEN